MSLKDVTVRGASAVLCLACSWADVLGNSCCREKPVDWCVDLWKPCKGGAECSCQKATISLLCFYKCTLLYFGVKHHLFPWVPWDVLLFFRMRQNIFKSGGSLKHLQKPKHTPLPPTQNFSLKSKFGFQISISKMSAFKAHCRNKIPNHFCYLPGNHAQQTSRKKNHSIKKQQQKEAIHYHQQ